MPQKALISDLTWRSLEMQKAAFPGMEHYVAPDQIGELLRPTTRKDPLQIYVMSFGVIAEGEKEFRSFIKLCLQRNVSELNEQETGYSCTPSSKNIGFLVEKWKWARRHRVAKIGGRISAEKRKADSKAGVDKIRDRWGLSSKTWPTRVLLKEADLSLNTVKSHLGSRIIAQHNYQAAQKRKARKEGKA